MVVDVWEEYARRWTVQVDVYRWSERNCVLEKCQQAA